MIVPDSVKRPLPFTFVILASLASISPSISGDAPENFKRENLVAWCIVSDTSTQRSPLDGAALLKRLELKRVVCDSRDLPVTQLEAEITAYRENGIDCFAFRSDQGEVYPLFTKHGMKPEIWRPLQTGKGLSNAEKVASAAEALVPLAKQAGELGLSLGLYNEGGWGGLPNNMVAVCKILREKGFDVGLIYNFHHAHPRIATFADDLAKMKPYLFCVNLNGMADPATEDVSKAAIKVKAIGSGKFEKEMIATLISEGYIGPVGVLGHVTTRDLEEVLNENLIGLEKVIAELPRQGLPVTSENSE